MTMQLGTPPFPISIDGLTAEVLGECLGAGLTSYESTRIGADRGMLGEIFLVRPEYEPGASGPEQVVVKFAALREGSLASARRAGSHERELRCYNEFLVETPVTTPECYATFYNPDDATFMLVQEAVVVDDSVDQVTGITLDQAQLVMGEAARLHAYWWNHQTLSEAAWLPGLAGERRIENLTTLARVGWPQLVDLIGDELSSAERRLGEEFPDRLDAALRSIADLPKTLLHCDLRADNLLFSPNGDHVTLVDWQGCGFGPPSFDLAYFISQSLTVDDRRTHEDQLLETYRVELAAAGLDLDADAIRAGYAVAMHYGLAIACALPLISDPGEARVKRLSATVARRSIEAMRDHYQLWET